jgi:hypothetical protein
MKNSTEQSYIVFLNNPSVDDFKNIANFVASSTGKPFFSDVVLFAANINGDDPENSELFYNDEVRNILENNLDAVWYLQGKGIKVQLSFLGNHQNAGWSANMSDSACVSLAKKMVNDINKFNLDGINIDDEYSLQSGNVNSFYRLLLAIRENSHIDDMKLTKALWNDPEFFQGETNVAPVLTEGYEMSYSGNVHSLDAYVQYGMDKSDLFMGVSPQYTPASKVRRICDSVIENGYSGVMVWAPNTFLSIKQSEEYYSEIIKSRDGDDASVIYVEKIFKLLLEAETYTQADGESLNSVWAILKDADGVPISDEIIFFSVTGNAIFTGSGSNRTEVMTDSKGYARASLTSTTAEDVVVLVEHYSSGGVLNGKSTVWFTEVGTYSFVITLPEKISVGNLENYPDLIWSGYRNDKDNVMSVKNFYVDVNPDIKGTFMFLLDPNTNDRVDIQYSGPGNTEVHASQLYFKLQAIGGVGEHRLKFAITYPDNSIETFYRNIRIINR